MLDVGNAESDSTQLTVYEIRLDGHLGRRWKAWFGGVTITPEDNGQTLLNCRVVDQAALYGLLRKVRDLGLPLLSVTQVESRQPAPQKEEKSRLNAIAPLQVELFVGDVDVSTDFYTRILGFVMGQRKPDGYTPLSNGPVTISLNAHTNLPHDHPVYVAASERAGRGVEFVLRPQDLQRFYNHVKEEGWPIAAELQRRPWGSEDFRVQDPDDYYWRITS